VSHLARRVDAGQDGFQFRAEQSADTRFASIPTIVWSAPYDPQQEMVRRLGTTMLRKGVDCETVLSCIEAQRRKE
jgi:hypothetical protein